MHPEAYSWIEQHATTDQVAVLDLGGRNINGSPRPLYPFADPYVVLDVVPGAGVDIVADAATWNPDREYDVVVCSEVFEHTAVWPAILRTAHTALRDGGQLVLTMAGPGRPQHSAVDGGPHLHPGEYYGNVDPADLERELKAGGWRNVVVDVQQSPADVRAVARK